MNPAHLGSELRHGSSPDLRRRRAIIGLSLGAGAAMGLISLYQVGLIAHPAEPTLRGIDARKVNGSAQAYSHFAAPDGLLGLLSYASTALLAGMGDEDRARRHPWIPIALAAKVGADVAVAAKLTWREATHYKKFCLWCLFASAATLGMLPLTWPEARQAIRHLLGA